MRSGLQGFFWGGGPIVPLTSWVLLRCVGTFFVKASVSRFQGAASDNLQLYDIFIYTAARFKFLVHFYTFNGIYYCKNVLLILKFQFMHKQGSGSEQFNKEGRKIDIQNFGTMFCTRRGVYQCRNIFFVLNVLFIDMIKHKKLERKNH